MTVSKHPYTTPCAIHSTSWAKKTWLFGMNLSEPPRHPRLNCWNSAALTKLVLETTYILPTWASLNSFQSNTCQISNNLFLPNWAAHSLLSRFKFHIYLCMWSPCWIAPPHPGQKNIAFIVRLKGQKRVPKAHPFLRPVSRNSSFPLDLCC